MKLATLKTSTREDMLIVVSDDLNMAVNAEGIVPTLQEALENWQGVHNELDQVYGLLCAGEARDAFPLDINALASPLPLANYVAPQGDRPDVQARLAVVTDAVPMGISAEAAAAHIRLMLLTDAQGTAFAPVVATPDSLSNAEHSIAHFTALIAQAASARNLPAGAVIGSAAASAGPQTNDAGRIEMLDAQGRSIFGAIARKAVPYATAKG